MIITIISTHGLQGQMPGMTMYSLAGFKLGKFPFTLEWGWAFCQI